MGSKPARDPNFWYSRTNMTHFEGTCQFLGSAIFQPRYSHTNNPLSAIFAYRAAKSLILWPPHDTFATFGVLKGTVFSSLSRWRLYIFCVTFCYGAGTSKACPFEAVWRLRKTNSNPSGFELFSPKTRCLSAGQRHLFTLIDPSVHRQVLIPYFEAL